jgi:Lon protease-like protein
VSEELPLFPLDMVLLPGVRVPLHIFEDRYRLMISECLDQKSEFAMMWGTDDDFKGIGCAARVTDVVNRFADGRLNIVIEGTDRISLIEEREDHEYIFGLIERVTDDGNVPDTKLITETRRLYVEALKLSIGWYRAPTQDDEDASRLSYTIASALSLPPDIQQTLLEQVSIENRFEYLRDILSETLGGLREHARRIGGNGKAH